MTKIILFIFVGLLFNIGDAFADKIYLKSGKIEEGKIQKKEPELHGTMGHSDWCSGDGQVILRRDNGSGQCLSKNDIERIEKTIKKPEGVALLAKDDKWGIEQYGYKTQLIPANTEYSVGQPMIFHLVMKNVGNDIKWYDNQAIGHDTLSIQDENRNEVYCKQGPFQTLGADRPIDAGEIVSLFENRNISDEYVIVKPGKYTIQFRGGNYGMSRDSDFPPSNIIEFDVKPGEPDPEDVLISSLSNLFSKDWKLSRDWDKNQTPLGRKSIKSKASVFAQYHSSKSNSAYIRLWLTIEQDDQLKNEEFKGKISELLGQNSDGKFIYIEVSESADKVWPTARQDISSALKLKK